MTDTTAALHQHHHHDPTRFLSWRQRVWIVAAAGAVVALNATGAVTRILGVNSALIVAAAGGALLVVRAVQALWSRQITYDVTIALGAIVALAVGEYVAAAEVVLIVLVGDAIEHWTIHRTDRAIAALMSVQPNRASIIREGRACEVPAAEVLLTDRVIVRSGERAPVDGVVVEGQATVDQALITGESMPVLKDIGATVHGGSIVEHGVLELTPERVGDDTSVARIARLVADARRRRAPIVRTADRLARLLLPALAGSAALVYVYTGDPLRSAAVLLVGCSCALVYAAPAAFAAALARLARSGVLVKGGDVLERLAEVTVVAFDKTGTLTAGQPSVRQVVAAPGVDEATLVGLAAAAESKSEHCLGRAIVADAERRRLPARSIAHYAQRPGAGVVATVDGREVRVGSVALMRDLPAEVLAEFEILTATADTGTDMHVLVAIDGRAAGLVVLHDAVRPEAARAVGALRAAGIDTIVMLTGDRAEVAGAVARDVGIAPAHVHAALLPADKLQLVRTLGQGAGRVLMVGDGINDAPALAATHVGLAFGRGAADLSAEAAQVVILEARLTAISDLVAFAGKTIQRVRFNILVFAVGTNAAAVIAAAMGYLTPVYSAVLHQVLSLAVILSSVSLIVEGRATAGTATRSWEEVAAGLGHRLTSAILDPVRQWAARYRTVLVRGAVAAAVVLWLASGITVLGPGESAVVQRFGKLVATDLGPGLHLRAPWPIETVTRGAPERVRVLEIGFRSPTTVGPRVPTDYEWNTSHDESGLVQQVPDENLVLTGDENLAELYAVVHYRVADLSRYFFHVRDADALVRVLAEGTLRAVTAGYTLETLLTTDRRTLEEQWAEAMRARLRATDIGVDVIGIHLADVHPPVEVVDAFRDVASAQEQALTRISQAEAYAKEEIPKAHGNAAAALEAAAGYRTTRVAHGEGDAARFLAQLSAPDVALPLGRFRLQIEALEAVLPGKRVFIMDDKSGAKRTLIFLQDGADLLKLITPGGGDPENESPDAFRSRNGGHQ